MYFVGQNHITNQLAEYLPHLYHNKDAGMNMLIRGPSGWGKTRMAFQICNYLTGGDFDFCLADKFSFNQNRRVHFIDEVHLLPNPEVLYPFLDSEKYIIVLATNDVALLAEALVNRCSQFNFTAYSIEELREIARMSLRTVMPDSFVDYIIESGGGNPRSIRDLIKRLNIILMRHPLTIETSLTDFKGIMQESFGIVDGLDVLCQRYIEALLSLGGTASIQTLSNFLHTDKNTIQFYVEPILLYKNKIKISQKGRSIND